MNIPMVDLKAQYLSIEGEICDAIGRVLNKGCFILGSEVEAFEKEIAAFMGVKYAIGVASGTDALYLALKASGIGSGDEVITTPFTFVATVEAIVNTGATPVFADINLGTFNIDPDQVRSKVTAKTKAILPVHLFGQSADMDPLIKIASKIELVVIEDCAQALGAKYKDKMAGSMGHAGCLSFFPSKNLGGYGDGGMVVTDDPDIAEKVRQLRRHGVKEHHYEFSSVGFNSRLDELQAAVLRVKLKKLKTWLKTRNQKAKLYEQLFKNVDGIEAPVVADCNQHAFNYYTVRTKLGIERDDLKAYLKERGISTAIYYHKCLHLQEAYAYLGYKKGDFPVSELASAKVLSLPIYPELSDNGIRKIVEEIIRYLKNISAPKDIN
jgi:dTDP-4-amino-4,6-dideoxygalactose transaminase